MTFTFMLAPMEDYTDAAFRSLAYMCGADLTFTEMSSIEGLAHNSPNTLNRIKIPDNTPTYIQIVGNKEDLLEKFLRTFTPENGFRGFNLNLGCPDPNIVRQGMGAAMIKRVSKVKKMIGIIRKHGYSCTIKMRLGLNSFEKQKKVYMNLIKDTDPDFFIVHARHGKENYGDKADFSVYQEMTSTGKIIIANGDIRTVKDIEFLKNVGVKGAMIGRAATSNPKIFCTLKNIDPPNIDVNNEYLILAKKFSTPPRCTTKVTVRLGKGKIIAPSATP